MGSYQNCFFPVATNWGWLYSIHVIFNKQPFDFMSNQSSIPETLGTASATTKEGNSKNLRSKQLKAETNLMPKASASNQTCFRQNQAELQSPCSKIIMW